ncbi:MFS transporter [Pseudomonas aeruginosa]|nr:MFS transporter [Pseudomonas aeruginosa]
MLVGTLLTRGAYFMVWPFLALLLWREFRLSASAIGLLLALATVCGALSGIYTGWLSDRFGRKRLIFFGTSLSGLSFVLLGFSGQPLSYGLAISGVSIGCALLESSCKALIGDRVEDRRSRELALYCRYFLINLGAALGPLIGLTLGVAAQAGTFLVTALVYFCYGLLLWRLLHHLELKRRSAPRSSTGFLEACLSMARHRAFTLLLLCNMLAALIYATFDSTLVQYLTRSGLPDVVNSIALLVTINARDHSGRPVSPPPPAGKHRHRRPPDARHAAHAPGPARLRLDPGDPVRRPGAGHGGTQPRRTDRVPDLQRGGRPTDPRRPARQLFRRGQSLQPRHRAGTAVRRDHARPCRQPGAVPRPGRAMRGDHAAAGRRGRPAPGRAGRRMSGALLVSGFSCAAPPGPWKAPAGEAATICATRPDATWRIGWTRPPPRGRRGAGDTLRPQLRRLPGAMPGGPPGRARRAPVPVQRAGQRGRRRAGKLPGQRPGQSPRAMPPRPARRAGPPGRPRRLPRTARRRGADQRQRASAIADRPAAAGSSSLPGHLRGGGRRPAQPAAAAAYLRPPPGRASAGIPGRAPRRTGGPALPSRPDRI